MAGGGDQRGAGLVGERALRGRRRAALFAAGDDDVPQARVGGHLAGPLEFGLPCGPPESVPPARSLKVTASSRSPASDPGRAGQRAGHAGQPGREQRQRVEDAMPPDRSAPMPGAGPRPSTAPVGAGSAAAPA